MFRVSVEVIQIYLKVDVIHCYIFIRKAKRNKKCISQEYRIQCEFEVKFRNMSTNILHQVCVLAEIHFERIY